jgi:hypothetical protein
MRRRVVEGKLLEDGKAQAAVPGMRRPGPSGFSAQLGHCLDPPESKVLPALRTASMTGSKVGCRVCRRLVRHT